MNRQRAVLLLVVVLMSLTACVTSESATVKPRYVVIDANTAMELFERKVQFIDVRTKTSFNEGHIPGAVNMTWGRQFTRERLAKVASRDQEIVIYCYGIHCELSTRATDAAVAWGYTGVHYFVRGFPAWWDADYPIEKS